MAQKWESTSAQKNTKNISDKVVERFFSGFSLCIVISVLFAFMMKKIATCLINHRILSVTLSVNVSQLGLRFLHEGE